MVKFPKSKYSYVGSWCRCALCRSHSPLPQVHHSIFHCCCTACVNNCWLPLLLSSQLAPIFAEHRAQVHHHHTAWWRFEHRLMHPISRHQRVPTVWHRAPFPFPNRWVRAAFANTFGPKPSASQEARSLFFEFLLGAASNLSLSLSVPNLHCAQNLSFRSAGRPGCTQIVPIVWDRQRRLKARLKAKYLSFSFDVTGIKINLCLWTAWASTGTSLS
jgi:hypothetical protein